MTPYISRCFHNLWPRRKPWRTLLCCALLAPTLLRAQGEPPGESVVATATIKPASNDAAQALQLVFRTVVLPSGRLDVQYVRQIVQGGTPPYTFEVVSGQLPEGLELSSDGRLSGVPTVARGNRFVLAMRDGATPPLSVQQAYSLRIDAPRPKPKPAPTPDPPPPPAPTVPSEPVSNALPALDPTTLQDQQRSGWIRTYRLTAEELAITLAPPSAPTEPPPALPESWLDSAAAPPAPTAKSQPAFEVANPERVQAMLQSMLGVEYPTREVFQQALQAARCEYLVALINTASGKPDASVTCSLEQLGKAAEGLDIPWRPLYEELLPPTLQARLLSSAVKFHDPAQAKPVQWRDADCGCISQNPNIYVYGFYSHWSASEQPQAVDFSQFTRISYLGASLNDAGGYVMPPHWNSQSAAFARTAHRFGTKLDLVLYRRDWRLLMRQTPEQQERFAREAAANAVKLVGEPLTDRFTRLKPYLLPGWTENYFVYDGITVFFDDAPTDPTGVMRFQNFLRRFMGYLITDLQATRRSYALNIVVPQQLLGEAGAYSFEDLVGYIETAEPPYSRRITEGATGVQYRGTTDISVALLLVLSEPTSVTKRQLRAKIDNTNTVEGHRRIAFLNGVMPVLLHATAAEPQPMKLAQRTQLDGDLAYIDWQYGGVALWPVPLRASGTGAQVSEQLAQDYYAEENAAVTAAVCKYICPNRSVLRLLLEVLVLVTSVAAALYSASCSVRRLGRSYLLCLWGGAALTLLVGLALLSCDPDLSGLRSGNDLLYVLLVMVVATGAYFTLKPKVSLP